MIFVSVSPEQPAGSQLSQLAATASPVPLSNACCQTCLNGRILVCGLLQTLIQWGRNPNERGEPHRGQGRQLRNPKPEPAAALPLWLPQCPSLTPPS